MWNKVHAIAGITLFVGMILCILVGVILCIVSIWIGHNEIRDKVGQSCAIGGLCLFLLAAITNSTRK